MIDVVYIIGNGSAWQDNELRYSLRSMEKHLKNYSRLIIVGELPAFINPETVEFIPVVEQHQLNKAKNIMYKVYTACDPKYNFTDNILVLNDDYFFVYDVDGLNVPYYHKCDLLHTIKINGVNEYRNYVEATVKVLQARNLPIKNFDVHKPIVYNKTKLRTVCLSYDWMQSYGYILRSLYCNTLGIEGTFQLDCKINHPHLKTMWEKIVKTKTKDVISIGDMSLNKEFKRYLEELYPHKSKYEL